MVTVVVLGAVGLVVGVGAGALLLVALALSVRAARVGRLTPGEDGLPLVGARHAQFGDATAAARAAGASPARPLRLVRPSCDAADQPQPARAA
ncbi:hypothetical protein FHN55_20220 [Streptomyces sp. NP160]|uniref:hypothetical protein n=1 Tax=Streptomyces sp. NP160 TaxID=2586637 RepID=UPI0011184C33|nr:hypothetical protein [Streptomyces sp. NP160]TNM59687.1 hypothetical protein FHN55_20220 [Streptomyces sp. NP160]